MKKLEESEILMFENLKQCSMNLFGHISYQTLAFCNMEIFFGNVDSEWYKSEEYVARRYMRWQSNISPKDKFINRFLDYTFLHENDLQWKDCIEMSKKYRKELLEYREKSKKEIRVITFEELEKDEILKEIVENNPYYDKTEKGYIQNDKFHRQ